MTTIFSRKNIKQVLQSIADHFALGKVKYTRQAGGTNQNYIVFTDQGQYLFKIIINTTIEEVEAGLPFLDRLEQHHFPYAVYYLKAANGSPIYRGTECAAVVLPKLPGKEAEFSEHVCREIGSNLAKLHLIPSDALPAKRHWIDNNYLPEALALAQKTIGVHKLPETLKVYNSFNGFTPTIYPQSIIHGDLDTTNCLFQDKKLMAFVDWQEIGVGASVLDFAMTILGFCFVESPTPDMWSIFEPSLYRSLYTSYTQVRPFTKEEDAAIEVALKYAGLTQPVWSMLHWDIYRPNAELVETNTLYWRFGLDTLMLPK